MRPSRLRRIPALLPILALLFAAAPATGQYIYLDANGDGLATGADVLAPSGSTDLDVWLRTDAGRDGTPAACSAAYAPLDLYWYAFILRAANGTMTWGPHTNRLPELSTPIGEGSSETEYQLGYFGVIALPPGLYRLATVTVSVAAGTPSLAFATTSTLPGAVGTAFGSSCPGVDSDFSLKLGTDWQDADGIAYGGAANRGPILAQPGDMTLREGETQDQDLTATDADGDPLAFRLAAGPAYASVSTADPGSGTARGSIHLAPSLQDSGRATATVAVGDGLTEDRKSLVITVINANRPPALDPVQDMSVRENGTSDQTIRATDPDADALSFRLVDGPGFVEVTTINPLGVATGNIHLAPDVTDGGEYDPVVGVGDGTDEVTARFHVTVLEGIVPEQSCPPSGEPFPRLARLTPSPRLASGFRGYDTGVMPQAFARGDLDGDGVEDAAVATYYCGVSILLGDGRGAYRRWVDYETGSIARAVAIADWDGDGTPDLAVCHRDLDAVAILRGTGGGFFAPQTPLATARGPVNVAAGDLDRDDRPDLVVCNERASSISVFRNTGNGTLGARQDFIVGAYPCFASIADLNGDGAPDLAVANEVSNSVSVLLGNGDGTFRAHTQYATGIDPRAAIAADVTGDGVPDLVSANFFSNSISVLAGNGDGTFQARRDWESGEAPWSVAVGDLNGDGIPDAVTANVSDASYSILMGVGGGLFAGRRDAPAGGLTRYVEITDADRDGRPDLLVANEGAPLISVHPGNGDGTFGAHRAVRTDPSTSGVALGDLDGDGYLDLVVTSAEASRVLTLRGLGDGSFVPPTADYPTPPGPRAPRLADVSGDGRLDVVVACSGAGSVSVLQGLGDGRLGPRVDYPVGSSPVASILSDLNQDGLLDVAVADAVEDSVTVLWGMVGGIFAPRLRVPAGGRSGSLAAGDFDRDGIPDLAVANPNENRVAVLLGGGGTFTAGIPVMIGAPPAALEARDADGDGLLDLFVTGGGLNLNGTLLVLRGRGDGSFHPPVVREIGRGPAALAFGELNGDLSPDVAVANGYSNTVSVLTGAGSASLDPKVDFGAGQTPVALALGDVNGDGRADVVTADFTGGTVTILLNLGPEPPPDRAPVADAGGPYAGVAGGPVRFDGSGSSDPDGDALAYAWTFGDGAEGVGAEPVHSYAAEGEYRVALTVRSGALADADTTAASIGPALPARAFATPENRTVRLFARRPVLCVQIEPSGGAFALESVDRATLRMRSDGTGSVSEIAAILEKEGVEGDRDRNGVAEIAACFAAADVRALFSNVTGQGTFAVGIQGSLRDGTRFAATLELDVAGIPAYPASAVAPNPLNPEATITVATSRDGPLRLRVFDLAGRLVRTLLDEPNVPAGFREVGFDGKNDRGVRLASGRYYYLVEGADGKSRGGLAILK